MSHSGAHPTKEDTYSKVGRPRKASVKLPPHLHAVMARGKAYHYFQRFRGTQREEPRVKLPGEPLDRDGLPTSEWWRAYRELCGEEQQGPKRGTFGALILAYKSSPEWRDLSPKSKSERTRNLSVIEGVWATFRSRGLQRNTCLS